MKTVICSKVGSLKEPSEDKRGRVEVIEVPEDPVGAEEVKIKVAYCAICGSDPNQIAGVFEEDPPFGLGHEVSGTIVELGKDANIKGLKVGDKVAGNFIHHCGTCYYCRNGQEQFCTNTVKKPCMSEYIVWHESQVCKIPDGMDLAEACLLEPVSIIVRIVDKAEMKIGQRVLISGGGPIGLLTLQAFKMYGATSLTLVEPIEDRQKLAKEFGADFVIDPLSQDTRLESEKITGGLGYDIIVETSGSPAAAINATEIVAKGGKVLFIAMYPKTYEMPLNLYEKCYERETTFTSINVAPYAFPRALQLLERMNLEPFTYKRFPIENAEEAFAAHMTGKWPKVLIKCNSDQ